MYPDTSQMYPDTSQMYLDISGCIRIYQDISGCIPDISGYILDVFGYIRIYLYPDTSGFIWIYPGFQGWGVDLIICTIKIGEITLGPHHSPMGGHPLQDGGVGCLQGEYRRCLLRHGTICFISRHRYSSVVRCSVSLITDLNRMIKINTPSLYPTRKIGTKVFECFQIREDVHSIVGKT
jgi:hypothetical protein